MLLLKPIILINDMVGAIFLSTAGAAAMSRILSPILISKLFIAVSVATFGAENTA